MSQPHEVGLYWLQKKLVIVVQAKNHVKKGEISFSVAHFIVDE